MLSLVALSIMCFGAVAASIAPHQSLVAIRVFSFSDAGYSVIMALGSMLSVAAAVGIGILTDQRADRRLIAAGCAGLGAVGDALVFLAHAPWAYWVAHVLIFPFSVALFGQLFAIARLATAARPSTERDAIMAAVWLLVLPAAMGAVVTLSVPIAYMQDLMSERPGAGRALIAVLGVTSQIIAAAVFAVGTALSGYGFAAVLGAALAAVAGVTLLVMDRRRAMA